MNRRQIVRFVILAMLLVCTSSSTYAAPCPDIQVHFSPAGGCTDAIVHELDKATNTVLVQAYKFSNKHIANAIVRAHVRGVHVTAIFDESQHTETDNEVAFLARSGVRVLIDAKHAIAHNKIMIIDDEIVICLRSVEAGKDVNL